MKAEHTIRTGGKNQDASKPISKQGAWTDQTLPRDQPGQQDCPLNAQGR